MKYLLSPNTFVQDKQDLFITHKGATTWFRMPPGFSIKEVSEDLKILCLTLLFYPLNRDIYNHEYTRTPTGSNIGMAYSGGTDSASMAFLLPEDRTIPFHHLRLATTKTVYKPDNQTFCADVFEDTTIKRFRRGIIRIPSTFEDLRQLRGLRPGFMNDYSFFAGIVLMADELGLGYLSQGRLIENSWIHSGQYYQDWPNTEHYKTFFGLFERAGLPLYLPITLCSEALTTKIVTAEGLFTQPCMRGSRGQGCNNCYKCFRKSMLKGELIPYKDSKEIMTYITKRPLKQASGLIHAMNKYGFDIPELQEYKGLDLSFLEKWFPYTLRGIPKEFHEDLSARISQYAEREEDPTRLLEYKI